MTARLPLTPVAAALAGVALFFFLFDPRLLDPGYVAWLMDGDPGTMYLGWRFFRAEDWGWPPGAMHAYGLDIASSIVYTDSIPLVALPAKLISAWLPTTFQYFGWWMLACYALQGWFGGMLADLAAERPLQRLAIALMFVASVPIMDRAIGHYALMSHWLVLWALWLALRPHRDHATLAWTAVACLASLVHAYLLYLVLAIWVADVVRRRHFDPEPRTSFAAAFRHVVVVGIALWIAMTIAGYFTLPRSAISGGVEYYGRFATNLNAFFNPQWGSRFLPAWPVIPGSELEGQAYLGHRRAHAARGGADRAAQAGRTGDRLEAVPAARRRVASGCSRWRSRTRSRSATACSSSFRCRTSCSTRSPPCARPGVSPGSRSTG